MSQLIFTQSMSELRNSRRHWFVYYRVIQDFLDFIRSEQPSEHLTLYIQGTVVCPLSVSHHSLFRHTILFFIYSKYSC